MRRWMTIVISWVGRGQSGISRIGIQLTFGEYVSFLNSHRSGPVLSGYPVKMSSLRLGDRSTMTTSVQIRQNQLVYPHYITSVRRKTLRPLQYPNKHHPFGIQPPKQTANPTPNTQVLALPRLPALLGGRISRLAILGPR